ncbi:MAG TPA: TGS domain-containing protein, partial [Oscillospiraceae bacterium]|nr:TGS domain-containing protein [Oscillospiraceae bacterium]
MINVTLKDGVIKQFEGDTTVLEVTKGIGAGLFKAACCAKIDGELCDLRTAITKDCELEIITFDDIAGKKAFWHTASHVLAQAVKHLYPKAKLATGPAIDSGFFYDFDVETPFTAEDLAKIEAEMKSIIKTGLILERFELSPDEAIKLMEEKSEPYKVELIREHAGKGEAISFYKQGDFVDLCAGPHLYSTQPLKAIKLTQCTGAYWRGDANNRQLCRVYGIAFPKQAQLDEHIERLEEAKRRDHRKLGRELDLFDIYEEGPGFPFFLPKGIILRNELERFWREEHDKDGYEEIRTPIMLNEQLWHTSGHYDHYKDNMYFTNID